MNMGRRARGPRRPEGPGRMRLVRRGLCLCNLWVVGKAIFLPLLLLEGVVDVHRMFEVGLPVDP